MNSSTSPCSGYDWGNAEMLEIGAGTGMLSLPLASKLKSVTAVDTSAEMLERLKEKKVLAHFNISPVLKLTETYTG